MYRHLQDFSICFSGFYVFHSSRQAGVLLCGNKRCMAGIRLGRSTLNIERVGIGRLSRLTYYVKNIKYWAKLSSQHLAIFSVWCIPISSNMQDEVCGDLNVKRLFLMCISMHVVIPLFYFLLLTIKLIQCSHQSVKIYLYNSC